MNADMPDVVDVGLRFLDRQILDNDDREVAKVDDLEAVFDSDGRPYVHAILCGPGAWAPRLGGRLGRWIIAIWRRLHSAVKPEPARIPMNVVTKLDSAVHLSVPRSTTDAITLDRWTDDHFIARIPGAGHDDDI
jgi:hypothetical protein